MPNVVIKYFYKEIKFLTNAIGETGLPQKLFKCAKEGNILKLNSIINDFEKQYHELYISLLEFYDDYTKSDCPEIFADEEDEKRFEYNPKEIAPDNMCVLMALSNFSLNNADIFLYPEIFCEAVEEYGQKEIAYYLRENYFGGLMSLKDAFNLVED